MVFHGVFLWLPQLTCGFWHWLVVNYQAESEDMLWWGGNLKLALCWIVPVFPALPMQLVITKHVMVRHVFVSQLWGEAASPSASLPAFFERCRLSATASLLLFPNFIEKNTNIYS